MRIEWVEWSHLFNFRSIQDLPEKHPETAKLTVQNAEKISPVWYMVQCSVHK